MTAPRRGQQAALQPSDAVLPSIPVVETGPGFPLATLLACKERAQALIDAASHRYPRAALVALDKVSPRSTRSRASMIVRVPTSFRSTTNGRVRAVPRRPRTIVRRV